MADVALATGAGAVVQDVLALRMAINAAGTIQTAVGTLSAVQVGTLSPLVATLQTDIAALVALIAADPGVP